MLKSQNITTPNTSTIRIEVAYATSKKQFLIPLTVGYSCSVIDAIILSKITTLITTENSQNIDISNLSSHNFAIGVFGKKIDPLNYILKNNDRIEIYRPLLKTPNQRRIERAKNNKNK